MGYSMKLPFLLFMMIGLLAFQSFGVEQDPAYCGTIDHDESRLACYDAIFGRGTADRKPAGVGGDPVSEETPVSESPVPEKIVAEESPVPEESPVLADAPVSGELVSEEVSIAEPVPEQETSAPVPSFGEDQLKSEPNKQKRKSGAEQLAATVIKVSKRPRGEYAFELENGQIWHQSSVEYIRVRPGDRVKIVKHGAGGYSLRSVGGRSTRVRRVQ